MAHSLPEKLQSQRLVIREPREDDARLLFDAYAQDIEVARYMIWRPHSTVAETQAFIARCIQDWAGGLRMPYVLTLKEDGQRPVGMLDARTTSHVIDIGYVLARSYWGRGLMPEAICTLVQATLEKPNFFRVQATCDIENRASARTLEKSGFVREARLERYTIHPNISPEPRPCLMYARCK